MIGTFYALDDAKPSLTIRGVGFFDAWAEMSAALAGYYGEEAKEFRVVEASWAGDEESAEIVMLDRRVIGALDRALTQNDVAAIWGVDRMEKRAFLNRIRGLFNIDGDLLPELTRAQQSEFLRDPVRFFLDSDEAQSDAIMREIEARQTPSAAAHPAEAARKPVDTVAVKPKRAKKSKARVEGQRELLLPIKGGVAEPTTPSHAIKRTRLRAG